MYNQLQTARLTLRRWRESDVVPFMEMNQDPEVMKYFPERPDASATVGMIERIEQSFEKNHFGLFVVELNSSKEFLGFTGFWTPQFISNFTPCIEIGWRFRREFWNRGFATEAALACLELGFQKLKFERVRSFTSALNLASRKLMERIGMQYLGGFNHPDIENSHRLCAHVVYEIKNAAADL